MVKVRMDVAFSQFAYLISECITAKNLKLGRGLHSQLIKTALFFNPFLTNGLIDMYAKCDSIETAQKTFDDLSVKTTRSWNIMISLYSRNGHFEKAHALFDDMPQPNLVSYNSLISGLSRHGFQKESIELFRQMQKDCEFLMLDAVTLVSVVGSCSCLGALNWLRQVHSVAIVVGFKLNTILENAWIDAYGKCDKPDISYSIFSQMTERDVVSWTSMVVAYARASRMDEACDVFTEMPVKNCFSWTALISGFAQNGYANKALDHFERMLEVGISPSIFTYVSVLSVCADLALIEAGKQIHSNIIRSHARNSFSNLFLCNALIDMYSKCGDMKSSEKFFEMIPVKDVVTWNSLITGFAQNGHGEKSLAVFRRMIEANVHPNHVTFLGVLSACSHTGLEDESFRFLSLMEEQYDVKPRFDHYAIQIDLLGRKNKLREALSLVEKASNGANHVGMWGAILSACRLHGNLDLAIISAEALFELEPGNTARYVMLSNIYAAAGHWEDARGLRRRIVEKGLKKAAAFSWIEVRNERHQFMAKDKSHRQIGDIYQVIDKLLDHMKDDGYVLCREEPFLPQDFENDYLL